MITESNVAETVLQTHALHRTFGQLVAVENLDLAVEKQQFYGFLGPNGAGKSTTIKMLTGLLRPTSGEVHILGRNLASDSVEIKRRIGVVPEGLALFERLCTHIGIIQNGRLVASGSLEELRTGVKVAGHDHSPLTLEEIFLQVVGGAKQDAEVLSWL